MDTLYRNGFIGNQITFTVPLTHPTDGSAFAPGETHALIFTAKTRDTDPDSLAVIQITSGAGITVAGSLASITIHPAATADLAPGTIVFDIQAQNLIDGEIIKTVAYGKLNLARPITRETTTSIPVITESDALPFGPVHTVTAGDELEIISNGITYYIPLYRRP